MQFLSLRHQLRNEYGYEASQPLKFADRSRPKHICREDRRKIKSEIIDLSIKNDVRFCGYLVLHEIAKNKPKNTLVEWGALRIYNT